MAVPSWLGPVLEIGGTLASGYFQNKAAGDAVDAGKDASKEQLAFARETRDLIRADNAPYRESGVNALNKMNILTGLPTVSPRVSTGSTVDPAYGDGNTPLGRAAIAQSFQDVFGRNADDSAINHYLNRGPREYKGSGGSKATGVLSGAAAGAALGPWGAVAGGVLGGVLGGGDDAGPRRSYTYNELMQIHRNSEEYQDKKAKGLLPPWEDPGEGSRNYGKIQFDSEGNSALYAGMGDRYDQWTAQKAAEANPVGATGGSQGALTASDIVKQDPSYQFRLDEGMGALQSSAAARGGVLSGGALRQMTRYAQDYASTEYTNIYNRLSNIAGLGQVATGQNTQGALSTGAYGHDAIGNKGYYSASGYVAKGNAIGNTIEQLAKFDWGSI